jgi:hypothetical protein
MRDDRKNVVDMDGGRVDDDHLLSMYIDNELDAEQTIALVSRLKSESVLRTRLTQLEENDGLGQASLCTKLCERARIMLPHSSVLTMSPYSDLFASGVAGRPLR